MIRIFKYKYLGILLGILFSANILYGQLIINTSSTPAQLVQNVLLGAGITASNITYTGSLQAISKFTTGPNPTGLGLSSGIIMASGNVTNAIGPNNATGAGTDFSLPGDAMLTALATYTTHDAAVLEFDFIPQGDTIKFRYVFGSEEYPEYVNMTYNDIFAFFLSGTDPFTYLPFTNKNIAIIPTTLNTPVSINNVNNVTPSYPQYYVNNTNGTYIQYDGFTTVLTAWCKVLPCTTYHIKLAIADAGDGILDSGVFLEAGSFTSAGIQTHVTYSHPGVSNLFAIEGCNDALVTMKMPYAVAGGYIIPFTVDPSSTAIEGVDYDFLTNPLVIPAGQDSASIIVHPLLDGITEGNETVILIVPKTICMDVFDTIVFTIHDYKSLQAHSGNDTSVACGAQVVLQGTLSDGIGPYNYHWSTGSLHDTTHLAPTMSALYHLSVTDVCNVTATDSILVNVIGPVANAGADTAVCAGDTAKLTAHGGLSYHWSNGANTQTIKVAPSTTTNYIVTVTQICSAVDTVKVTVNPLPVLTITSNSDSLCPGDTLHISASGADTYQWTTLPPEPGINLNTANPDYYPSGTAIYTLSGHSIYGCTQSAFKQIIVKPTPSSTFSLSKNQMCQGDIITIQYTGTGLGSSVFDWNFGGATTLGSGIGPYNAMWDTAGHHDITLLVTQQGCKSLVTLDTVNIIPKPNVGFFATNITGCPPFVTSFYDTSLNVSSSTAFQWTFGDGNGSILPNPTHNYTRSGVYNVKLIATNLSGCADTAMKPALVRVHPVPIADFSVLPQRVTIFDPTIKFYDLSEGYPVSWLWNFGDMTTANSQNVTHLYADTGNYIVWLIVTNAKGCVDSTEHIAIVTPDNTIYFPNAFSPNGDGVNDIYKGYGTNIPYFSMDIFDRWGSRVFTSNNIDMGWDGTVNGQYALPDVYIIIVKYRDVWGGPHSYYGKINLIR